MNSPFTSQSHAFLAFLFKTRELCKDWAAQVPTIPILGGVTDTDMEASSPGSLRIPPICSPAVRMMVSLV